MSDMVGIAFCGINSKLDLGCDSSLGAPVCQDVNESVYLRVTRVMMPTGLPVTIVLSRVVTHVSGSEKKSYPTRTCIAILLPKATSARSYSMQHHSECSSHTTVGAKWIHGMPIKLFSSRNSKEKCDYKRSVSPTDTSDPPSSVTVQRQQVKDTMGCRGTLGTIWVPSCLSQRHQTTSSRPVEVFSYDSWIRATVSTEL